jgi:CubicO group peptidase (beta-lactamase class C family)
VIRLIANCGLLLGFLVWPPRLVEGQTASPAVNISGELAEYMQAQVGAHHFSGAVLVAQNGKILLAKGYGFANFEWRIPNTPQPRFRIGSLTKQFTATLIMQLTEAKLVDLQDSICKYLDPCVDAWRPVTLSHLLSHTSGIAGYGDKPDPKSRSLPPWTAAQIAVSFHDKPLEFTPGTKWKYSDWGYVLLGMVIEKVTAKPYATVLQERIFGPLGMRDSGYDLSENILLRRAAGYRLEDKKLVNAAYIDMRGPFSGGALRSTSYGLKSSATTDTGGW